MKRAIVVADGRLQADAVLGALGAAGFEAVPVASVAEVRSHVELGAAAVLMGFPAEGLDAGQAAALAGMPSALRRSCVVALLGPGLVTWDGTRAFFLGVDLTVSAADAPRVGELLAAAVASKRTLVTPLDPTAAGKLGG